MIDLKKRTEIRKEQMEAPEILMTKIRADIKAGWMPQSTQDLAGILKVVSEYAKSVGRYEECKEILEKTSEGQPMTMEKVGVQCGGNHVPDSGNMDKKASGVLQCRYCGQKLDDVRVADTMVTKESIKQAGKDAKGAVEKMLGIE